MLIMSDNVAERVGGGKRYYFECLINNLMLLNVTKCYHLVDSWFIPICIWALLYGFCCLDKGRGAHWNYCIWYTWCDFHSLPTPYPQILLSFQYYFLPKSTFLSLLRRWSVLLMAWSPVWSLLPLRNSLLHLSQSSRLPTCRLLEMRCVSWWFLYFASGIRIHCSIQRWRF